MGEVEIENEVIRSVGFYKSDPKRLGSGSIDLGGNYLVPGFIELQINGGFGKDFTSSPKSIWEVARKLPRYGVTTFLPTIITSPYEKIFEAQEILAKGPEKYFIGAEPLGLHLEGPFLNPKKKGTHSKAFMKNPSIDEIDNWRLEKKIRLVTLAPELPNAIKVIKELSRRGIVIGAGHSYATYDEALIGIEAGITYGTHIFNAQTPMNHREPGLPGALLMHSNVTVGIIPDGFHVHPAIVNLVWKLKGHEKITLVTDAIVGLAMPPGNYTFGDFKIIVNEQIARKPDGTISGSILGENEALKNFVDFTKCSIDDAIPTLTSTPAKLLGLENKGYIKDGYIADLVELDGHLEVVKTFISGKIAFLKEK